MRYAYNDEYDFLKVTTLAHLVDELFEIYDEEHIELDSYLASNVIFKLIEEKKIAYFSYLDAGSKSLQVIYDFFVKLSLNDIEIKRFRYKKEKNDALQKLQKAYKAYKKKHHIFDRADIVKLASKKINDYLKNYEAVLVDSFKVGDITLHGSKAEKELLEKIKNSKHSKTIRRKRDKTTARLYKNKAFNAYDEVRTAIKIAKKLMIEGASEDEIVIVSSDVSEYLPYYYNLLDEYGMKGYDTVGVPLSSFGANLKALQNHPDTKVQKAYWKYVDLYNKICNLSNHFTLPIDKEKLQTTLLQNITVKKEREGVLFDDVYKLAASQKGYKHIIFVGTDITHFPKKIKDNFLYTQKDAEKRFFVNNPFMVAKTTYEKLKNITQNLYIVTATYKGKRKLTPSIVLDKDIQESYNIEDIHSRADLLKEQKRFIEPELQPYQNSISSVEFSIYDGLIEEPFTHGNKLSASALNTYQKCPLQYYFGNVLKLKAPQDEEEGFDAAGRGNLIHKCFELFTLKVKELEPSLFTPQTLYPLMLDISNKAYKSEEIQDIIGYDKEGNLKENINHKITLKEIQQGLDDPQSDQKSHLSRFVDYVLENKFEYFRNSHPEEEFMLGSDFAPIDTKEEQKRFIKGFIDRLDDLTNEVNIIDYKSSLNSYSRSDFVFDENGKLKNFQLGLYMLYARQKYPNKKAYSAHLVSFKEEKPAYIELDTKKYDDEYETKMKEQIVTIKERINGGRFAFDNSDAKVCEHCDYATICHQGVLQKGSDK